MTRHHPCRKLWLWRSACKKLRKPLQICKHNSIPPRKKIRSVILPERPSQLLLHRKTFQQLSPSHPLPLPTTRLSKAPLRPTNPPLSKQVIRLMTDRVLTPTLRRRICLQILASTRMVTYSTMDLPPQCTTHRSSSWTLPCHMFPIQRRGSLHRLKFNPHSWLMPRSRRYGKSSH